MTDAVTDSRSNVPAYSVSELSQLLKRKLEENFGHVTLRGELSGFKRAASGHIYFGLKDDKAVIDGVIWKGQAARLDFRPEDGLEVLCTGRVTTYPARSRYQIIVERMEPAGEGALMAQLARRRKALEAEGLFDPARKQALPFLPERIGVVTSPTGAVIRDILHRLDDRFPRCVTLWPVKVQGEDAAGEIAAAIRGFNLMVTERPDLLIVARGGGSIEDLWAFNEEIVVRAAADSEIPLISAVGHETDTTLIDHAADMRAPTPTAAAELAVPVRSEIALQTSGLARRALLALRRMQGERRNLLKGLARGLTDPRRLLQQRGQRLDDLGDALARVLKLNTVRERRRLADVSGGLRPAALRHRMQDGRRRFGAASESLKRRIERDLSARRRAVKSAVRLLEGLSYKATLQRGYAVVRDGKGQPLTRAALVRQGATLAIEFADGETPAVASGEAVKKRPRPPGGGRGGGRGGPPDTTQGDLF